MGYTYDPLLCSRCHRPIKHINEIHKKPDGIKTCAPKKRAKGAYVYLLWDKVNELLKIGFTESPLRRFKEIRNANTNTITIIGTIPGSKTNESILHRRWRRQNKKLEWFNFDDDIIDYFKEHPQFQSWEIHND